MHSAIYIKRMRTQSLAVRSRQQPENTKNGLTRALRIEQVKEIEGDSEFSAKARFLRILLMLGQEVLNDNDTAC